MATVCVPNVLARNIDILIETFMVSLCPSWQILGENLKSDQNFLLHTLKVRYWLTTLRLAILSVQTEHVNGQ
jgi:hypothetical protein